MDEGIEQSGETRRPEGFPPASPGFPAAPPAASPAGGATPQSEVPWPWTPGGWPTRTPTADGSAPDGPFYRGAGPYGFAAVPPPPPARPRRDLVAAFVLLLVLVAGAAGAGIAYVSRSGAGSAGLAASPGGHSLTTAQIAAKVDPAVVDIDTNLGEGTGMIVSSNGEIVTNNHVIEGASYIKVAVLDRGTYAATVVGTDATADIAVVKINGVRNLPTVTFANSSALAVGSTVVAIGNAGGQGFPSTVTSGAVTALGRTITASDRTGSSETLAGMIQTDAVIEPGNSGGPLVDSSGEVVGMDTAAASTDGATPIGFALPSNRVVAVAKAIEKGQAGNGIVIGTVAFLGVEGVQVTGHGVTGVALEYVEPGSPAQKAGLQAGDVITAFDGHPTSDLAKLATLIHNQRVGDKATVTFDTLGGSPQTVTVTLGAAPPA